MWLLDSEGDPTGWWFAVGAGICFTVSFPYYWRKRKTERGGTAGAWGSIIAATLFGGFVVGAVLGIITHNIYWWGRA